MLKKAVSYVRVSSKEQNEQGYSPEAQRTLLYDFARRNMFDIVKEFEEAETAKNTGRKEFAEMLEYVRTKEIKHILVEKTDRLHRNFKDYVSIEELTEQHGVTVYFVKEGSSIGRESRASDKTMYGIKTVMAKGFIDNLKEEVQKGFEIKIAHGEYPRQAPLGYVNGKDPYNPKHSIILVDPRNVPLIVKLFEYYATGIYSMKTLICKVDEEGLTTNLPYKSGGLFVSTVARVLADPFYIGKFNWKGAVKQGSHEPLVSIELWEKVQRVIQNRNKNKSKEHNVAPFTYKGLFTCGECGRGVTAEKHKGHFVYYHCTKYKTNCKQGWVKEETIDERLKKVTSLLKISEAGVAFVTAALKQSLGEKREWQDKAHDTLLQEQQKLRTRLDRMYEDRLDRKITEEQYDKRFKEYTGQLEALEDRIAKYNKANINYYDFGHKILELAENAEKLLNEAEPEEKRELNQYLLSNSTLKDGVPVFALKTPFSQIERRSPCDDRPSWQRC